LEKKKRKEKQKNKSSETIFTLGFRLFFILLQMNLTCHQSSSAFGPCASAVRRSPRSSKEGSVTSFLRLQLYELILTLMG
jgi:hypothetical protein